MARDRRGAPFQVGVYWRTVAHADKLAPAELTLLGLHADEPAASFRIADQPKPGVIPEHVIELTPGLTHRDKPQRRR